MARSAHKDVLWTHVLGCFYPLPSCTIVLRTLEDLHKTRYPNPLLIHLTLQSKILSTPVRLSVTNNGRITGMWIPLISKRRRANRINRRLTRWKISTKIQNTHISFQLHIEKCGESKLVVSIQVSILARLPAKINCIDSQRDQFVSYNKIAKEVCHVTRWNTSVVGGGIGGKKNWWINASVQWDGSNMMRSRSEKARKVDALTRTPKTLFYCKKRRDSPVVLTSTSKPNAED